jgi:hypothetical protein
MKMKAFLIAALVGLFSLQLNAADKVYSDGNVWTVTMVKTSYGHGDAYITGLQSTWKQIMEMAKKDGVIVSYKVLAGASANKEDFDMILMVELKNMAALDTLDDKMDVIEEKVVGNMAAQDSIRDKRVAMREILGNKLMREVVFK